MEEIEIVEVLRDEEVFKSSLAILWLFVLAVKEAEMMMASFHVYLSLSRTRGGLFYGSC